MQKLLLPQEIETFYVIPSLRKNLAKALIAQGNSAKKISDLMMLNKAAVSQYVHDKRGNSVQFTPDVMAEIVVSASRIKNQYTYLQETQHLLKFIRKEQHLCGIHKDFSFVPKNCDPVKMGCLL